MYAPCRGGTDLAGGDSLVAHPRGCRPRCEVVCRKPGRHGQCTARYHRLRESGLDAVPAADRLDPRRPGVYQFKDAEGRVLYVGKAKSLRHRLSNYLQDPANLLPRTAQMVAQADHVEWMAGAQRGRGAHARVHPDQAAPPRFNVRLKDDKSYPFLADHLDDEWPRPVVVRGRKRKGIRYFGPYGHAYAIRETLDLLLRTSRSAPARDTKFTRHERLGRPCLLFHIEKCSGPCVGAVDHEAYDGSSTS